MDSKLDSESKSRREFVKRAVYITPAILTLAAAPAYAKCGSHKGKEKCNPEDTVKKEKIKIKKD